MTCRLPHSRKSNPTPERLKLKALRWVTCLSRKHLRQPSRCVSGVFTAVCGNADWEWVLILNVASNHG